MAYILYMLSTTWLSPKETVVFRSRFVHHMGLGPQWLKNQPTSRIRAKRSGCVCKGQWEKHVQNTCGAPNCYQNVTKMLVVGCCFRSRETSNGWYAQQGGWVAIALQDGVRLFSYPVEFPEFHSAVGLLVYKLRFHVQEKDVQIAKFSYLHLFATFHLLYE